MCDCTVVRKCWTGGFSVAYEPNAVLVYLFLDLCKTLKLHELIKFEAPALQVSDLVNLSLVAVKDFLDACFKFVKLDLEVTSFFSKLLAT